MALYVDLVKNDWLGGQQYRLATLRLDPRGKVYVLAEHPQRWRNIVDELNQSEDPAAALASLHTRLRGSHLFATEAHHDEDDSLCRTRPVSMHGEVPSGEPAVGVGG